MPYPLASIQAAVNTVLQESTAPYYQQLLDIFGADIVSYLPMDEASGATAADLSGNSRTGAYNGVTLGAPGIGDGKTCPSFDGTTDFVNWYTASHRTAFNGEEGSLVWWFKLPLDVWNSTTFRYLFRFYVNDDNYIYGAHANVVDNLQVRYRAGASGAGVSKTINTYAYGGNLNWMLGTLTWSKAGDAVSLYINGTLVETQNTLGAWEGLPVSAGMNIGAYYNTGASSWLGNIAHFVHIDRPITAPEVARIWAANPT